MARHQGGTSQMPEADALYAEAEAEQAEPGATPAGVDLEEEATPSPEAQSATAAKNLTEEDVLRIVTRAMQSQKDKRIGKLEAQIQQMASQNKQLLDAARAANMPPEQVAALERSLRERALNSVLSPEEPQSPAPEPNAGRQSDPYAEINAMGERLAARYGLADDDPELQDVKVDGTPDEYLFSIAEAGAKKRARMSQAKQAATRSPAVAPAGGKAPTQNPLQKLKLGSVEDYYSLAEADFAKAVGGGARRA